MLSLAQPAQVLSYLYVLDLPCRHGQYLSHLFFFRVPRYLECQEGGCQESILRPFAPVMPVTAMQIAVACGWICLLNVLTILALKVLNRESHANPQLMLFAAAQASLVNDSDVRGSAKEPPL